MAGRPVSAPRVEPAQLGLGEAFRLRSEGRTVVFLSDERRESVAGFVRVSRLALLSLAPELQRECEQLPERCEWAEALRVRDLLREVYRQLLAIERAMQRAHGAGADVLPFDEDDDVFDDEARAIEAESGSR